MRIFDTYVQGIKYKVIRELIKALDNDKMDTVYYDIPKRVSPGPKANLRCCIYKERAIVEERIKTALGGDENNKTAVELIDIACDECPAEGILVTTACRGCLSHRCKEACPKGAITIVDKHSVIDKEKCIECGKCVAACPYKAIIHQQRPCVTSCKVKAISVNPITKKAAINQDKCVSCGACVYQCPFGAIQDRSFIAEAYNILKNAKTENYNVYAVVAPSIVGQFNYAKIGQVVAGIKKLGFYGVVEAALGADVTLNNEAEELKEREYLTSSCCPSFVMFVEKNFPELVKYVSTSASPMVETARLIKEKDNTARVVFIGPCTSKKLEYRMEKTGGAVDGVISFEELQAFLDAREIDCSALCEEPLWGASYFGRIFARSGGLAEGVKAVAEKKGVKNVQPIVMNGLDECRVNLLKLKLGRAAGNFFEGMACDGGCINGALCLHHGTKNAAEIDTFGKEADEVDVLTSAEEYKKKK